MEKKDLFELIESYLDDTLPDEKRREVEQRMAEDKAFRQEVELHSELQENFSDPGRWHLHSTLAQVMEESLPSPVETTHSTGKQVLNRRWKWIVSIAAILLAGIGVWYLLQLLDGQPTQKSIEKESTEKPSGPVAGSEGIDTAPVVPPKETVSPQQKPQKNELIAQADPANFIPNPGMEAFVNSGSRSGNLNIKISSPVNRVDFLPNEKGEVLVRFAGMIEDNSEDVPEAFVLAIYDNKDANKPLVSTPLELKKDPSEWAFEIRQQLKFQPGLYYFTIEREGEMEYAGKFTIGKRNK